GALVHGPRAGCGDARIRPRASRHGRTAVVEPAGARARPWARRRARIPRNRARRAGAGGGMKPGEIAHAVSRGVFYLAIEKVVALVSGTLYFALLLRWMGPTKYGI